MNTKKVQTSLKKLSPILIAMLNENIDVLLTITGSSMEPLLTNRRDTIILSKCDKSKLRKGDMALYNRQSGQYVLHRIVKVNRESYDFCGDNQYIIERNLPKQNIIAVVKAFKRNGKLFNCNDFGYKIYWHLRVFSIPFRKFLHMAGTKSGEYSNEKSQHFKMDI